MHSLTMQNDYCLNLSYNGNSVCQLPHRAAELLQKELENGRRLLESRATLARMALELNIAKETLRHPIRHHRDMEFLIS